MTPESKSSKPQEPSEDSPSPSGPDGIEQTLRVLKLPRTLENYIEQAYMGDKKPEDLGPEEVAELPHWAQEELKQKLDR